MNSITNTSVVALVSCAHYWSLILKYVYEKEGIIIPIDDSLAEFGIYRHLKVVTDDLDVFLMVARVPDSLLRKVNPTHPALFLSSNYQSLN